MSERVCAVVVTYNRKELLRECLQALTAQTHPVDEILVVNNASSDGTVEMIAREFPQIKVLNLLENIGGAGGFHEGIRWSYDQGFEWSWAMDDDCIPESDTLQGLLEGLVLVPEKPVGVLQSYQKGWNNHSRPAKIAKSISEFIYFALKGGCTVPVVMGERSPIAIDWFQLVSVLIARSAVEKVGFPRKELFLYADDTDYAYRIGQAGFHMYLIPWSIVNHIGGKSVEASAGSIPNWRWYYIYRNQIATVLYNREHLNYLNVFIALLRTSGKAVLMVAMSLMVRNISKSKYVGLGLLDGYYLRLGKTVQPQRKL